MGQEEVAEERDDEDSDKQASDIVYTNESEQDAESPKKPDSEIEKKEDNPSEKKEDSENLRKIIKVGPSEGENEEKQQKPKEKKIGLTENDTELSPRESIEQKREILQSIKDFDFQIKKNQEDLTTLNKKLDNVTKDLDDLVSLYEIVSEQMNPFVGLSKVTKKRIDALENFTKEIELLKERTGELESFAERSGVTLKKPNIEDLSDKKEEVTSESEIENNENPEDSGKSLEEDVQKTESELSEKKIDNDNSLELQVEEVQQSISLEVGNDKGYGEFTDSDWDIILERAFSDIIPENKIDVIIDDFLESLKG